MEALNALFALADSRHLLRSLHPKITDRAFLYADDVVIFLTPDQQDLTLTRGIPEIFAGASGLKTNAGKCMVSPIQCNLEATSRSSPTSLARLILFPSTTLASH